MARGSIAKQEVINKIKAAFGSDYIGEYDKKIYVKAFENGEKIQIALSLTCPKVPVETNAQNNDGGFNFEDMPTKTIHPAPTRNVEISEEEKENIAKMMARLGL